MIRSCATLSQNATSPCNLCIEHISMICTEASNVNSVKKLGFGQNRAYSALLGQNRSKGQNCH